MNMKKKEVSLLGVLMVLMSIQVMVQKLVSLIEILREIVKVQFRHYLKDGLMGFLMVCLMISVILKMDNLMVCCSVKALVIKNKMDLVIDYLKV